MKMTDQKRNILELVRSYRFAVADPMTDQKRLLLESIRDYWSVIATVRERIFNNAVTLQGQNACNQESVDLVLISLNLAKTQAAIDLIREKRPGALNNQAFVDYILSMP